MNRQGWCREVIYEIVSVNLIHFPDLVTYSRYTVHESIEKECIGALKNIALVVKKIEEKNLV
jgi:hypothetical protein